MSQVIRTWDVTGLGTGRADYSALIWKGLIKMGFVLDHNQTYVIPALCFSDKTSNLAHFQPPLVPGASIHAIDTSTGNSLPYTINAGETLKILTYRHSFNELMQKTVYFDGQPISDMPLETLGPIYEDNVLALDSEYFDPEGASAHTFDIVLENTGTKNAYGYYDNWCVLTLLGSPRLPETKKVNCKWCGLTSEIKHNTLKVKCKTCGKETWYYPGRRP